MFSGVKTVEFATTVFWRAWTGFAYVGYALWHFPWHYLIDIGIMTTIVYHAYRHFRATRAMRILMGIVILGLGYLVAQRAGLFLTSWLLWGAWVTALIFFIVIFQGEIRQILEQLDLRPPVTAFLRWGSRVELPDESLAPIADVVFTLASKQCGALMVLEQREPLDPLLQSPGEVLDALISPRLVETLFTPPTPLHDGALYIRGDRIYRAGCVLPLSEKRLLAPFFGTRHRAALGIAEQSDASVVVVSEERGTVSVVENGMLTTVHTPAELLKWLKNHRGVREDLPQRTWPLRTLVSNNWRLKLTALAAVSLLWFVLVERQNTEVGFSVPLAYRNVPPDLMIEDKDVQEVYVSVRGSPEILNFLDTKRLRITLNLRGVKEGWHRYTISANDINLPLGLQLADMSPSELKLRLSKRPSTAPG
jgi:uncharacterized protein (TIGR00159 family)